MDGCMANSCTRESTVVFDFMAIADDTRGFDLDNADGDGDPYTGIDNVLGDGLLTGQLNPIIQDSLDDGSIALIVDVVDIDDLTDDPVVNMSMHELVDPACPAAPVYDAYNLPPWIGTPPAEVYSDRGAFAACVPPATLLESDDPATNGIYPANSDPAQPPAPFIMLTGTTVPIPLGGLGALDFANPRIEASLTDDGTRITAMTNGLLGGVVPAEALWAVDTSDILPNCPTALHVVLGLLGQQPDQDLDPAPGGIDTVNYTCGGWCFIPCVLNDITIDDCVDAETGAVIPDVAVDGDCTTDPRIGDGYSSALDFSAVEIHVVETRDRLGYCPP